MLKDQEIDALLDVFQSQMQNITDEYLRRIGKHIADIGTLAPSDVNRLIEMQRVNKNTQDFQRRLAEYSGKSVEDIAKIFVAVAQSDARFLEGYFNRKADPQNMRQTIEAQLRVTYNEMKNISNTTLSSQTYRKAVDSAVTAVQSGVDDYHTATRRSLQEAAVKGLQVVYPSGVKRRADTAVRQNVLDGIRSMNQQILYSIGEEFGADGVEISAHMLCAEDHLPYQGRQYDADTFKDIQDGLKRPFGMWNCRHTMYPIILGVSEPAYDEDELNEYKRYSTEPITIGGKTMSRYEWTQEMRRTETALRWERDKATVLEAAGDKEGLRESLNKQNALKSYYSRISEASGVKMDYTRAQASGLLKNNPNSAIMSMDSSKYWHPITSKSVSSVQNFTEFDTPEMNQTVTEICKEILNDLKFDEIGTEEAISIQISDVSIRKKSKGDPGDGTVQVLAIDSPYVVVHNHPSNQTLSYRDIRFFIKEDKCKSVVAIGNNGRNVYIISKDENYDFIGAMRYKLKQEHNIIKFKGEEDFLKGVGEYGIRYIKRSI